MSSLMPAAMAPVAPPAPPAPPAAHARGAASANADAAPQDFAQALDDAVTAEPRLAARGRGAARTPAGKAAPDKSDTASAKSGPLPAGKSEALSTADEATTDATPAGQPEADTASRPDAPTGVVDLLAQLRAIATPSLAAGADASAQDAPADPAAGAATDPRAQRAVLASAARAAAALTADATAGGSARAEAPDALRSNDDFALRLAAAPAPQTPVQLSEAGTPLVAGTLPGSTVAHTPGQAPQAQARLPATPGSAEFGPQLGAQITTFARAGVQHARLQLNPADMGPVSVHIQLGGHNALVHLSAENPQTRQALEQAMPQLASSLREAGLTLTGGGVFQQPHQGRDPAAQAGAAAAPAGTRGAHGEHGEHTDAVAAPLRRRGVVDLVA